MSKINDYFCTPEQGKRLMEMGIGGDSIFQWEQFHMEGMSYPTWLIVHRRKKNDPLLYSPPVRLPALMHQEIRNLCWEYGVTDWEDRCMDTTSEQFAKMLIDHLEAQP